MVLESRITFYFILLYFTAIMGTFRQIFALLHAARTSLGNPKSDRFFYSVGFTDGFCTD